MVARLRRRCAVAGRRLTVHTLTEATVPVRAQGELMQLDPPARGVGLRSAGPAYASTASKSLRPALAVSPRSALALRRCLSFETPRGGRSGTRRSSLGGGAWVTSRGGGAFTTPLNARVPRRGRASLDSAPTPLPDTPELDGAEEEEEEAARTGSARRSRSRSSTCGRCNCKKSKVRPALPHSPPA